MRVYLKYVVIFFTLLNLFNVEYSFCQIQGDKWSIVFPGEQWELQSPKSLGIIPEKLEEALQFLEAQCGEHGVKRVAVIRNGYLIWKGDESKTRAVVASVSKVFTSTVLGLLIEEKKCRLNDLAMDYEPVLKEFYPEVTLRHLANMTSGYDTEGVHERHIISDGIGDWSSTPYKPATPLFEPGEKYLYYDEATFMLGRILTRRAGEAMHSYLDQRLAKPIGIGDWEWNAGAIADTVNGIPINWGCHGVKVNAEQLARFGHLYLNKGNWNGEQIIDPEWVDQATRNQVPVSIGMMSDSRSVDGRGIYGYHWFINGIKPDGVRCMPDATPSTITRSGAGHHMLIIIPEWQMVITRLGPDKPIRNRINVYNTFLKMIGESIESN